MLQRYEKYGKCAELLAYLKKKLYLCTLNVQKGFQQRLMAKQILIVIIIIAACVALLCIRIILQKNGKFSSEHISQNKRMKQDHIHCATSQDRETRNKAHKKLQVNQL